MRIPLLAESQASNGSGRRTPIAIKDWTRGHVKGCSSEQLLSLTS